MKITGLIILSFWIVTKGSFGQIDVREINKPIELLNEANEDIKDGKYKEAVPKLLAAAKLNPKLRDIYISLTQACPQTNQISILKEYLKRAQSIFIEDDEICYYLGNVYQIENRFAEAIREYTSAIKYAKKNGEEFGLTYAYYLNRGNCYLKRSEFQKAIQDYTYSLSLNDKSGALYANRGIAYFKTGKRTEACRDWKKAKTLGVTSVGQYLNRYCK